MSQLLGTICSQTEKKNEKKFVFVNSKELQRTNTNATISASETITLSCKKLKFRLCSFVCLEQIKNMFLKLIFFKFMWRMAYTS